LDENNVHDNLEQANFIEFSDNDTLQLISENNDNEENIDTQSDVSLQSERQSNNSDSNSEDGNENILIVNEDEKEQYLIQLIREWALEGGQLSMKKLDNLLKKLSTVFVHLNHIKLC